MVGDKEEEAKEGTEEAAVEVVREEVVVKEIVELVKKKVAKASDGQWYPVPLS